MSDLEFDERTVDPDPLLQFERWLDEALAAEPQPADGSDPIGPLAMVLATATPDGKPSARLLLLRGVDERGFRFYTNTESRKGAELAANPRVALVFHWPRLGRQVRVEGRAEPLARDESAAYFASRPMGHRLAAWASPQSEPVASRADLDDRYAEAAARFAAEPGPPLPPFWGGYLVRPELVEFWQHRENRLHDRVRYTRTADGGWRIERLAP